MTDAPRWPDDAPHPADAEDADGYGIADEPADLILGSAATWHQAPAEEAAERLAKMPDLFLRANGAALVWVDDRGRSEVRPRLNDLDVPTLRGLFGARRTLFGAKRKNKKDQWETYEVPPPAALCERIITTRPGNDWRIIRGVADAPYLLGNGELVNEPGYSDGLWLLRNAVLDLSTLPDDCKLLPDGYDSKLAAEAAGI